MPKGDVYYTDTMENEVYSHNGKDYVNMNDSKYIYYYSGVHDDFLRDVNHSTMTYAVVLNMWTLFTNVVAITVCMVRKHTKLPGFHVQVVNLCASNLVISVSIMPLSIYHILGSWNFGEFMCKIYIIADVIMPFTSVLIIIMINIDRVIVFSHPNLYKWMFEGSFRGIIIFSPWLTSLIIVVPLWTSGTLPYENLPGDCVVLISKEVAIACPIITFFIPLVTLISLTLRVLMLRLKSSPGRTLAMAMKDIPNNENIQDTMDVDAAINRSVDEQTGLEKTLDNHILTACLLSITLCLLWLPYQSLSLLLSFCTDSSCIPSAELIQFVTWLGTSSAGVIPLTLLTDIYIRERLTRCCCMRTTSDIGINQHSHSEETYL